MTDDPLIAGFHRIKARLARCEEEFPGRGVEIAALVYKMVTEGEYLALSTDQEPATFDECLDFMIELRDGEPDAIKAMMVETGEIN